jgi:phage terminase Nu1 subunit (DNA packaging protein)
MPAPGTAEAKNLASIASFAAHGQADPRFEAAFSRYWYHFKGAQVPNENEEEEIEEVDDEDSEAEE